MARDKMLKATTSTVQASGRLAARSSKALQSDADVESGDHAALDSDCRKVRTVLDRIGEKWSILAIKMLSERPHRFNELRRALHGVTQRMLTLTLRSLERDGLVTRTVTTTVPPRVDYELTPLGLSLGQPIEALTAWALANHDAIAIARDTFDAVHE
jgi:DNA-binding HxlR family transcriptional regulator